METNIVIDTSIIINFTRERNNSLQQLLSAASLKSLKVYIPTVVLFEVFVGREMLAEKQKKKVLKLLDKLIRVGLSEEIALLAAKIARETNLPFDIADFIIAATVLKLNAELATDNIKHFKDVPRLKLFDFAKFSS